MVNLKVRVINIQELKKGGSQEEPWMAITFVGEEVGEQYPQKIAGDIWSKSLGMHGFKAENFKDQVSIGDIIDVELKLSCREYNGRYYNEVKVWSYKKTEADPTEDEAF